MWLVYFLAIVGGIAILMYVMRVVVLVDRLFKLVNEIRRELKEDQSQSQR